MIELTVRKTLNRGAQYRERAASMALVLSWRDRWMFQAPEDSWMSWFEDHLEEAQWHMSLGGLEISAEESEMLDLLTIDNRPAATSSTGREWPTEGVVAVDNFMAMAIAGPSDSFSSLHDKARDCPPCWRCRYFDGWLPKNPPVVVTYVDPSITAACAALDKRKVEIAEWVRAKGWEDLEGGT